MKNCEECGSETGRLYRIQINGEPDKEWCAGCVRMLGLIPEAKSCRHLLTADCDCLRSFIRTYCHA